LHSGFALAHSGRPDDGILQFEQALRLGPRDPERGSIHNGLAGAYLMKRQYEKAAAYRDFAIVLSS